MKCMRRLRTWRALAGMRTSSACWIGYGRLATRLPPDKVFVVHGEDQVCDTFASLITKEIGIPAIAPYSGDIYDLAANACIARGSRERKAKKTKEGRTVSTVFTRLLAAAERLLAIVRRSEGRPNKELGKLADQINAMCDKWED